MLMIGCGAAFLQELGVLGQCTLHLNSLGDTPAAQPMRRLWLTCHLIVMN